MSTLLSPIVGSHFVPPAKALLLVLPAGTPLRLEAEPENPYDPNAIRVWVSPSAIPSDLYLELDLMLGGMGMTLEEVLEQEEFCLGHVAASGGAPLAKSGLVYGTLEVGELLNAGAIAKATLEYLPTGAAVVRVESESEGENA